MIDKNTKRIKVKEGEEFLTLNSLLKFANLIDTGGMAKVFLSENKVLVNGVSENRRGRKLYRGDIVLINDEPFIIE